jgi:L,D-transpeptidase ErfK/SrfK
MVRSILRLVGAVACLSWATGSAPAAEFPLPSDGTIVGALQMVTVESDVTLFDIARHFDLGADEIMYSNQGVDMWVPGHGRRVLVPTEFILPPKPWTGIVLDLPARRLYYFPKPGRRRPARVITFPIGLGRLDWPTPLGRTTIVAKIRNPSWVVPKTILAEHELAGEPLPSVVPPGPDNPMGLLALQTGFPEVFIHGTNQPWGVGSLVSHGCIHLYPEDVAAIFDQIPLGTEVRIIDAPYLVGERNGVIFLSAFQPLSEYPNADSPTLAAVKAVMAYLDGRQVDIDWNRVAAVALQATTVLTPVNSASIDFLELEPDMPARPYRFPAYGPEANSARPPGNGAAEPP